MSNKHNKISTKKMIVNGKSCFGNMTINGNLMTDDLQGVVSDTNPVPTVGLLGIYAGGHPFWAGSARPVARYYDETTGLPITNIFPSNLSYFDTYAKLQFNADRDPNKIVKMAKYGTIWYIETYDLLTTQRTNNVVNGLPTQSNGLYYSGIVWDAVAEKYLINDSINRGIWSVDPDTFIATNLTGVNGGGYGGGLNPAMSRYALDLFILNDKVFKVGRVSVLTGPIFDVFDRVTGQFIQSVNWTGSFQFTKNVSKWITSNAANPQCLGSALNPIDSRLWLLIDTSMRALFFIEANDLASLETLLLSGSFDLTMTEEYPKHYLNSIAYTIAGAVV